MSDPNKRFIFLVHHLESICETRLSNHPLIGTGLGQDHFWTSGTDQGEEGNFFWLSTGRPVTYTNWNAGEPNNFVYENGEEEHCLELWNRDGKGLKWNDTPCSFETYFICEVLGWWASISGVLKFNFHWSHSIFFWSSEACFLKKFFEVFEVSKHFWFIKFQSLSNDNSKDVPIKKMRHTVPCRKSISLIRTSSNIPFNLAVLKQTKTCQLLPNFTQFQKIMI